MAELYAGCDTAEDVLMFFEFQVEAALHMDSAAARGICRREGFGKVNEDVGRWYTEFLQKLECFCRQKV